ncbi:30S ribosomal protein S19 [Candidatus Pacearchaeota archaeon CG10_big_fil_rev_8_21_14_0_10_35_13]|nr:MAG: 30S ribosomal protein S19 [Candidatus Pacearchaeota archaeon CG10_big_fil_rev_8_21_14_0_10_35_13]
MIEPTKKEYTYRGKGIEELKKMGTREFAVYLPSRERRTVLRHFDVIEEFIKKCVKKTERGRPIKTHSREIVIVPGMIGFTVMIHSGKEFLKIKITEEMLGHRLGEFAPTRKKVSHGSAGIGATRGSASRSVK